jgi:translation initiation factor 2 beta subunit (eIF-2beta)/eIF-5
MKLTMSIGCDGRLDMILNTIRVCSAYFDKIIITDSGNWIINNDIEKILKKNSRVVYIKNLTSDKNFQHISYQLIYECIEEDEWFLYFDSDERPNFNILKNLSSIVEYLDTKKSSIGMICGLYHLENEKDGFFYDTMFNCSDEKLFKKNILVKNVKITDYIILVITVGFQMERMKYLYLKYIQEYHTFIII